MKPIASLLLACVALMMAAPQAFAQAAAAEVNGKVEDLDGNPVPGAVVTLVNVTSSSTVYSAKTNKKGRYYLPALIYFQPGDWDVKVEAEGYAPDRISVESRKSNKTLVIEPYETGMRADKPHRVRIAAFGKAKIDFVMASAEHQAQVERKRVEEATAKLEGEQERSVRRADPLGLASNKMAEGDLAGSIEFFEKAVEADPDDPERKELYAKVLYNLERYSEAEVLLDQVIELTPDRPGIHLLAANVHAVQGSYAEAREALAKEAELSPQDVRVFQRLAWIAEKEGKTDESIRANESVVALDPENVEAWLALGDSYAEKKEMGKSEQAFTRVIELDPSNAYKTFFNIGVLIENRPNPSPSEERRALEAFRKAVEIKPDYAKAHRHLAYALLRSGDLAGARKELELYLEFQPDAGDAGEVRALVSSLPK